MASPAIWISPEGVSHSYLKLTGKSLGLLINLNLVHLKHGTKRFVNGTGWK
jgi:hypothetical protein